MRCESKSSFMAALPGLLRVEANSVPPGGRPPFVVTVGVDVTAVGVTFSVVSWDADRVPTLVCEGEA